MFAEECNFLVRQLAVDHRERCIAAKDDAPVARQAIAERARQAVDADDCGDAERDADEKDAQAREAAA